MAYSVLEELKDQALTCQICFEIPGGGEKSETNVFKQLKCSHIFCKLCIQKLIQEQVVAGGRPISYAHGYTHRITCPNCRAITRIKGDNVDTLPSAFQFTSVIEWINKKQETEKEEDRVCREHGVPYNFFCVDCSKLVCGDGLRLSQSHEKHATLYVKTEAEPIRMAAQEMMKEIQCQLDHWKKAHEEVRGMISSITDDTSKALESLKKYTEEIKRSLTSAQDRLTKTIMDTQKRKIELLERRNFAIMMKILKMENKMLVHEELIEKADKFEVFNEHVAITKLREEFLTYQLPDTTKMTKQTKQESLIFSPNFISLKRLKNDIAQFGKVHKKSEAEPSITIKPLNYGLLPTVLKCMQDAVHEAYSLDVSKLSHVEERTTKSKYIVNRLKEVLGEKWNCCLGDFIQVRWQGNKTQVFSVNDVDRVSIYKSEQIMEEHKVSPKKEATILHSSYNTETDEKMLECVKKNVNKYQSTGDTAFNIAQEVSAMMKTPWQCIIHNNASIGLSKQHIERMRNDIPSMVTVRVNGKDVWLLKMISFV